MVRPKITKLALLSSITSLLCELREVGELADKFIRLATVLNRWQLTRKPSGITWAKLVHQDI